MPTFTETIPVNGQNLGLYLSLPDGDGPFPGVVVGMHAGGTDTFIHTMCDRLSEANYVAAAPDLYHRLGINDTRSPRTLKDLEMIADVEATVAFLNDHPRVDNNALGITGFCMGGRVAYLMAAAIPGFKAAVAYYGGNTMTALGENIPSPFERTADIACPLMFHFGEADQNPSPEDMKILDTELTRHAKEHEFFAYPNAGHAFMDFTGSRYNETGDRTSWPRTIEFFDRHLK